MSQWGEERTFETDGASILVLPNVDTGGAFDTINLESRIDQLCLMSVFGDRILAGQLFERVKQQYEGRPYAEWRRPGPPQPAPVSPMVHVSSHNGVRETLPASGKPTWHTHEAIPCMIRQAGDSTWCQAAGCGLRWDTNEADPPRCPRIAVQQARRSAATRVASPSRSTRWRGWLGLLLAVLAAGSWAAYVWLMLDMLTLDLISAGLVIFAMILLWIVFRRHGG